MSNYFDNPATGFKQYRGKLLSGQPVEYGTYSFTTTGVTVEVPTYLSKIVGAIVTPQVTLTTNETLFCDLTVTSAAVTVARVSNEKYMEYHFAIDNGHIGNDSANDLDNTPLMVALKAMTLTEIDFYKGTAFGGGTVTFDFEKYGSANYFLNGGAVVNTAGTTDVFTIFAQTAIAAADVLIAQTNGGTTSGPADLAIAVLASDTATANYTSGVAFNYFFIGTY